MPPAALSDLNSLEVRIFATLQFAWRSDEPRRSPVLQAAALLPLSTQQLWRLLKRLNGA